MSIVQDSQPTVGIHKCGESLGINLLNKQGFSQTKNFSLNNGTFTMARFLRTKVHQQGNYEFKNFFHRLYQPETYLSGCIISSPLLLPLRLLLWLPMKPNKPPPNMWEKISSIPPPPPLPSLRPCSPQRSYNSRFSGLERTSQAKLISLN